MTTVISVRGRDRAELEADPNFVYVGRVVSRAGWKHSIWANPFKTAGGDIFIISPFVRTEWFNNHAILNKSISTTEQVIDLYRQWVQASSFLMERLPGLRSKTLGCWCGSWAPSEPEILCHAVCLATLANALEASQ